MPLNELLVDAELNGFDQGLLSAVGAQGSTQGLLGEELGSSSVVVHCVGGGRVWC